MFKVLTAVFTRFSNAARNALGLGLKVANGILVSVMLAVCTPVYIPVMYPVRRERPITAVVIELKNA